MNKSNSILRFINKIDKAQNARHPNLFNVDVAINNLLEN